MDYEDDEFLPEIEAAPGWQNADPDSGVSYKPSEARMVELWGIDSNESSISVSDRRAMSLAAFYSGVTLISEAMGSIPINVYKPNKSGSWEIQDQHPSQWMWNRVTNGWKTPSTLVAQLQSHLLFSGNGIAVVKRNNRGQGIALESYMPYNVRYYVLPDNSPYYALCDNPITDQSQLQYTDRRARSSFMFEEYTYDEVFHPKAFSTDGYTGISVLRQARESLNLGLTIERFGQKFFEKGRPSGFLTKEGRLSKSAKETARAEWMDWHEGVNKAFSIGLLTGGWKWESMGYTNDDAQFLASRVFQVLEIARWLKIPPHMLGEISKATNSNIEALFMQFVMHTLRPWIVKWEQEMNLKLLTPKEQRMGFRIIFDVDAWLESDSTIRASVEEKDIRNGVRTLTEVRNKRYLPLYPEAIGDSPLIIASQLDLLKNVINGTSKLHGVDKPSPASKTSASNRVSTELPELDSFGEGLV